MRKTLLICCALLLSQPSLAIDERFVDTDEDIILDNETGLMWTQNVDLAEVRRVEVQEFADLFTLSGYIDWRVPTETEVEGLFRGLREWGSGGLFINFSGHWRTYLGQDGSGIKIYWNHANSWGVQRVEELPERVHVWLVRGGPHSVKRYTQAEVDAIRDDAYNQGLLDAGGSTPVTYSLDGTLHIPIVLVPDPFGGKIQYQADLRLLPNVEPMCFQVESVRVVQ